MMGAETYKCTSCGNTITVYVTLSEPPVCHNKHIKGGRTMVKTDKANKDTDGTE